MKGLKHTPESFWALVDQSSAGCWEWPGHRNGLGYGRVTYHHKDWTAHRLAWVLPRGPIPEGMFVCHRCDNPPCIRPDHLFLGTAMENNRDALAKGRYQSRPQHDHFYSRGENNHAAVLTVEKVLEIRRRYEAGETKAALSREFGVAWTNIRLIVERRSWRHVG